MYQLRDYQLEACNATTDWIRKSVEPCLIELPTGAGKSLVVAELARRLHTMSRGKSVMCLAPSKELVIQNREKYLSTGEPASIYSASAGAKCLRHPVVFGSPQTVKNAAHRLGNNYCAIIIDEAHGITPTIKFIIEEMKKQNPRIRVIGLSATPYRLGSGYIYRTNEKDKPVFEGSAKDPYFAKLVYRLTAHHLIRRKFLTAPTIAPINVENYDTSMLELNRMGKFNTADIDKAFVGHGRKTAAIVGDVVNQSKNLNGIMFFAATIQHAEEVMASLPQSMSRLVTGSTNSKDREKIISDFKSQEFKYLVNVSVLTTGFDAPHVDGIAILRATESVGLLQQIVGRGLRLSEGKSTCMIWDYAENIDNHCPDGDIFNPEIRATAGSGASEPLKCVCPLCNGENEFSPRKNDEGYKISEDGYFVDLDDNVVATDFGPMPAHYGRRCQHFKLRPDKSGELDQCPHRWTFKECPHCESENDIAARYCTTCKGEIIDPNEKLRANFKAFKKDPTQLQTDKVVSWKKKPTISRSGRECLRVDYMTEYRSFAVWYMPTIKGGKKYAEYKQFCEATAGGDLMPTTVTYRKNAENNFYDIHGYNGAQDEI